MRRFVDKALHAGWHTEDKPPYGTPNSVLTLTKGLQRIVIEISPGGLPRRITRTHPDGSTSTMGQNYIRMSEVEGWLGHKDK